MSTIRSRPPSNNSVVLIVRIATLSLSGTSSLANFGLAATLVPLAVFLLIGLAATLAERAANERQFVPYVEASLAAAMIALYGDSAVAFAPYLATPGLAAGLRFGLSGALLVNAVAAALLLVGLATNTREWATALWQWPLIALGVGLLGAWLRRLKLEEQKNPEAAYRDTARLLEELRPVARSLPGGLEPQPLASAYLAELATVLPSSASCVAVKLQDGWTIAAVAGADEAQMKEVLRDAENWPKALHKAIAIDKGGSTDVLIPTMASNRVIAVTLAAGVRWDPHDRNRLARSQAVANAWSLRITASVLFQEIRTASMMAERSRLAGDIHDGIAQDVASLGYVVDEMIDGVENPDALVPLRDEIARIVGELRLSIYDLREEGLDTVSLPSAIGEVARRQGRAAGMVVHLRLGEGSSSMTSTVELELFKIAQEAIVNARKHSKAKNLWVSCISGPGGTSITVEDDGVGMMPGRPDSYGLTIMSERAARIGADTSIRNRMDGGTVVYIELQEPPRGVMAQRASADS